MSLWLAWVTEVLQFGVVRSGAPPCPRVPGRARAAGYECRANNRTSPVSNSDPLDGLKAETGSHSASLIPPNTDSTDQHYSAMTQKIYTSTYPSLPPPAKVSSFGCLCKGDPSHARLGLERPAGEETSAGLAAGE